MRAPPSWPWALGLIIAFGAKSAAASDWATPDFRDWAPLDSTSLHMTSYAGDPEASAVFLFDRGHIFIVESAKHGQEYSLVTSRYRRIKVLRQAGEDLGNVRLKCRRDQVIRNIEARTVLSNGRNVPLHYEEIHTDDDGPHRTVSFALPAVSPGCILEYRYEVHADLSRRRAAFLRIDPWIFPNGAPTLVSTLHFTLPPEFSYAARFLNAAGVNVKPRRTDPLAPESYSGRALQYTWEFHDLPAFRPEPHMGPLEECLLTACFRMTALGSVRVPETWDDLANHALEHFDAYLRTGGRTQKWLRQRLPEGLSAQQRAAWLYEFVRDSLLTAAPAPQWGLGEPWLLLHERSASPAERNLLLTHLLRQSGIDARLVLIASRDQPQFDAAWPTLAQFDHVLGQLKLDDRLIMLDASCRECPFGLLPADDRVTVGLVPGWEAQFLHLSEGHGPNSEKLDTQVSLDPPSEARLRTTWTLEGLAALDARRGLRELGAEHYASSRIRACCPDARLLACAVEDDSSDVLPLRITVEARVPEALVTRDGERFVFSLPLMGRNVASGFEADERVFPVELDYPLTVVEEVTIALPPGVSVDYLPPDDFITGHDVTFAQQGLVQPEAIRIARRFSLLRDSFSPAEYAGLRDVLMRADSRRAEPLILRMLADPK